MRYSWRCPGSSPPGAHRHPCGGGPKTLPRCATSWLYCHQPGAARSDFGLTTSRLTRFLRLPAKLLVAAQHRGSDEQRTCGGTQPIAREARVHPVASPDAFRGAWSMIALITRSDRPLRPTRGRYCTRPNRRRFARQILQRRMPRTSLPDTARRRAAQNKNHRWSWTHSSSFDLGFWNFETTVRAGAGTKRKRRSVAIPGSPYWRLDCTCRDSVLFWNSFTT